MLIELTRIHAEALVIIHYSSIPENHYLSIMSQFVRIILAIVAAVIILALSSMALVGLFEDPNPGIAGAASAIAFFLTYRLIKPKKKPTPVQTYWPKKDGERMVKEKGHTLNGKREGEWSFFDERGEFIKAVIYKNGEEVS